MHPYKKILIPVDLDEESSWVDALPKAIALASAFGASLTVMTVVPDFGAGVVGSFFPDGFAEKAAREAEIQLAALCERAVPAALRTERVVAHGTIYEEVLETARTAGIDLIVMASHRPKLADYLLGPNAARVVRHATCSVLVVR